MCIRDRPCALSFDPDILLTSAKTGYGLDKLLQKLDETLSDRVHTIRVLLPYDKLGLAAPMRERGSVQLEEYREEMCIRDSPRSLRQADFISFLTPPRPEARSGAGR